jgi:CDP-diacylglycerol---serine O-phosphatidyltransferase
VARVWRRRRSVDTPRPAGRRWARLRRSGSRATQVIARVTGRRERGMPIVMPGPDSAERRDRPWARRGGRRELLAPVTGMSAELAAELEQIAPVSPALGPSHLPSQGQTIPLLPGDRTPARRLKFAIANGCTIGSLLMGMVAVFLAIYGGPTNLQLAAVALLGCVVFDGFDGGLARKFNVSSPFGAQLDSLADLSSFGVATGIVVFQWLVSLGASPIAAAPACALIAVCAAIRLARFNVSPKDGTYFCGVPTTMVAAVLALNILVGPRSMPVSLQIAFVAVYALAMVSSFPYVKLLRVLRLPLWVWVVPAICAMISVPGTFVAIVGGYLASGPLLWLYRRGRGARPARPALAN